MLPFLTETLAPNCNAALDSLAMGPRFDSPAIRPSQEEEEEMDLLLDEIPNATSPQSDGAQRRFPLLDMCFDDVTSAGLRQYRNPQRSSSSSGSSSLSGNISPDGDDPFRLSPELGGRRSSADDLQRAMEGVSLLHRLRSMHVRDEEDAAAAVARRHAAAAPFWSRCGFPSGDDEYAALSRRSALLGSQQHASPKVFDSSGYDRLSDALISYSAGAGRDSSLYGEDVLSRLQIGADGGVGWNSSYNGGIREQGLIDSVNRRLIAEAYLQSQQDVQNRTRDLFNARSPLRGASPELHCARNGREATLPNLSRNMRNAESFDCDDSSILKSKGMDRRDMSRERRRGSINVRSHTREGYVNLDSMSSPKSQCAPCLPAKYDNLMDVEGSIYYMAKDQHGCRFLQKKFDEGEPGELDVIFKGIIDHVVELMVNPFGNYLMQKLLDVCSEEQRMRILLELTEDPAELVRISLNTHGTRAVQKLIETLKTGQQIALVVSALKPGFLNLIKDLNGNHVVQKCLQSLSSEDNKFIFEAAAKHCVDIATHRHGCCVLQRCIAHSSGEHRAKLIAEISANGLLLAQDAFGNYVVQYILDLENSSATANLVAQFEGNYVHLSMQKFSSNVVEKCLKVFREEDRARIIVELLSVTQFEQLLQDPYANYVIQSALGSTKGSLHAAFVDAIRPHGAILRTSPYCKRIFSRTLLKK